MRVRAGWCNQSPMKSPWGESKTGDSILKGEFVLPASCTTRSRVAWIQWDIKSSNSLFQRYRIFWPEHYLCTGHYIALMYRNVQNPCKTYQISELSAFLIWKFRAQILIRKALNFQFLYSVTTILRNPAHTDFPNLFPSFCLILAERFHLAKQISSILEIHPTYSAVDC